MSKLISKKNLLGVPIDEDWPDDRSDEDEEGGPLPELWEVGDWEFDNREYYAKITKRYELFYEYLRISPSYALALSSKTEKELAKALGDPERASKVWQTKEDAGDVCRQIFKEWWLSKGIKMFGVHARPPRISAIAPLFGDRSNQKITDYVAGQFHSFLEEDYEDQGRQDCLLVSIPMGRSRLETRREIEAMLDWFEEKYPSLVPLPKYKLERNRIMDRRLELGLRLVSYRAIFHKEEFWRVAARAKISDTHKVDPFAPKKSGDVLVGRRAITIMGLKLYNETLCIAENAAMGAFPSLAPLEPCSFELPTLRERLLKVREIEQAYKDAIMAEIEEACREYSDS